MDPGTANGGPLLGLKGIVIKSHGGADARAFSNAIRVGLSLATSGYERDIIESLAEFSQSLAAAEALAADATIKESSAGETLATVDDKVN
jgi:glycerol-3-phosphate acyltransferase PlsX